MPLDPCSLQSSPSLSTSFGNSEARSEIRPKSTKRSSSTNGVHRPNGKLKVNGVHVNGVHGNSTPIPYVPVEPRPNSAAPSNSGIRCSQNGNCTTCGRKNVLVTMPPMARCVDRTTCEETRKLMGVLRSGKPIPVTKTAIVCTERHGKRYYLKKVFFKKRELRVSEVTEAPAHRVHEEVIGEALELVREKNEATKFPPDKANQLAAIWGAIAREV